MNIKAEQICAKTAGVDKLQAATDCAITRLHCHLSECVYVWVYIIVIQYQLRHYNVIMSKKLNALTLRNKVALINEAELGKSCRQLADQFNIGRTQATSIIKRKAELLFDLNMTRIFICNTDFSVTNKYII